MGDGSINEEKVAARKMLSWALTERLEEPVVEVKQEVVYKAEHRELGRTVALKVFSPNDGGDDLFVERLRLEGRLMAQLKHSNVVGIHDAGVLKDGTPYLVLEYVEGEDLQKLLKERRRLGKREAIRIAVKVCNALSAVHELGIVHRDIKPGNILLGENGLVKVSDFGISKDLLDDFEDEALTLTGTTVGTVDYMSPEQSKGKVLDVRSDIYSVGVLIYEMISGVTPRGAFEPLTKWGASKDLDRLVRRCLQREREKRPASAKNLALQLRGIYRGIRKGGRGKVRSALLAVVVALLAVGVMVMFTMRERVRNERVRSDLDRVENVVMEPSGLIEEGGWVNLIDELDVARSLRVGRWWKVEGMLLCHEGSGSRLFFGKNVGESYVVECELARVSGGGIVGLFLPTKAGTVVFEMGVGGYCGVEVLGGKGIEEMGRQFLLENGRSYLVRVEVARDSLEVFVDGVSVGRWSLLGQRARVPAVWGGGDRGRIGVGADDAQATFARFRVRR